MSHQWFSLGSKKCSRKTYLSNFGAKIPNIKYIKDNILETISTVFCKIIILKYSV